MAGASPAHAQLLPELPDGVTGQELIEMVPRTAQGYPELTVDNAPGICVAFLEGARAHFAALPVGPLSEQAEPWPGAKNVFPDGWRETGSLFVELKPESVDKARQRRHISAYLGEYDIDRDGSVEGILITSIWPSWRGESFRVDWLPHNKLLELRSHLDEGGELTEEKIASYAPLLGDAFAPAPERKRVWHYLTDTPNLIIGPTGKLYTFLDGLSEVTLDGPKQICDLNSLPRKTPGFDPYQFFQGNRQRTTLAHNERLYSLLAGAETALSGLVYNARQAQGLECRGGTLHAHIRMQRSNIGVPARALLQPWKLPTPYNERGDVSGALESWSFGDPWSRKVYLDMLAAYPQAQAEIKARLISYFEMDPSNPSLEAIAGEILYRVVGEHFTFGINSGQVYELREAEYSFVQNLYRGEVAPAALSAEIELLLSPQISAEDLFKALQKKRLFSYHYLRNQNRPEDEMRAFVKKTVAREIVLAVLDQPALLKVALESGLSPEAVNIWGKTALMYAAQLGYEDAVGLLLEAGASPNSITITQGTEDSVHPFEGYCSTPFQAPRTALEYALQNAHLAIVEKLLAAGGVIDAGRLERFDFALLFSALDEQSRASLAVRLEAASRPLADKP